MTTETKRLVAIKNNKAVTHSRIVASHFGKTHAHVLETIRILAAELSPEISGVWFTPVTVNQKTGFGERKIPAFEMTRDGFALLVMGFTGKKALKFKVAFIEQFNAMEAQLRSQQAATPMTATEVSTMMAKYMADTQEKIVAPLVQAIADLIRNQAPQAAPALSIAGWNLRSRRPQLQAVSPLPK